MTDEELDERRGLIVPKTVSSLRFRALRDNIYVSFPTRVLARPLRLRSIVFFDVSTVRLDADGKGEAIASLGNTLYIDYDEHLREMKVYETGIQELREGKVMRNKFVFARRLSHLFERREG